VEKWHASNIILVTLSVVQVVFLALLLFGVAEIINTIYDKGINVHMHQRITTEHCTWDVTTKSGTIINMKGD